MQITHLQAAPLISFLTLFDESGLLSHGKTHSNKSIIWSLNDEPNRLQLDGQSRCDGTVRLIS
jgi:hypothetical protein